jgi:hypothetical protein
MVAREDRSQGLVASCYERARWRQSLVDALPGLLLAGVIAALHPRPANWLIAGGLVAASVLFRWIGRRVGQGLGPGIFVAWVPLLLPVALRWVNDCCAEGRCQLWCSVACGTSGLITGLWLARIHARLGHHPLAWLVSASVVVGASIAGCHCVGLWTTVAFVASLVVSGASGVAIYRRGP